MQRVKSWQKLGIKDGNWLVNFEDDICSHLAELGQVIIPILSVTTSSAQCD